MANKGFEIKPMHYAVAGAVVAGVYRWWKSDGPLFRACRASGLGVGSSIGQVFALNYFDPVKNFFVPGKESQDASYNQMTDNVSSAFGNIIF